MPQSWRPEVFVENRWSANQVRFATEAEADAAALNLLRRWTLCEASRAAPSEDPVNSMWVPDQGTVFLPTNPAEPAQTAPAVSQSSAD